MRTELTRVELIERTNESFLQYYTLTLGISQNVILGIYIFSVKSLIERQLENCANCGFSFLQIYNAILRLVGYQPLWRALLTFFLIVGIYYAYYWYTILFRRTLTVRDITLPILISIAQAAMIFTLESRLFFLATAVFYIFAGLAMIYALQYSGGVSYPKAIQTRITQHLWFCVGNMLVGFIFSIVVFLNVSFSTSGAALTELVYGGIVISYWLQEKNFIRQALRIDLSEGDAPIPSSLGQKKNETQLRAYFYKACLLLASLFGVLFYGTNFVSGFRFVYSTRLNLEAEMPYFPAMYVLYFSALIFPLAVLLFAKKQEDIKTWAQDCALVITVSAIIYLIFPTSQIDIPDSATGPYLMNVLDGLTGEFNLFPSLHVAFTATVLMAVFRMNSNCKVNAILSVWFVALCFSTLLVHKHYVLDIVGGIMIALVVPLLRAKVFEFTSRVRSQASPH